MAKEETAKAMKWLYGLVSAAVLVCGCGERGDGKEREVMGRKGGGVGHEHEGSEEVVEAVEPTAGVTNAAATAEEGREGGSAAALYGSAGVMAPVRAGKTGGRWEGLGITELARRGGMSAREAMTVIEARSEKLREKYGGQDRTPRGERIGAGVRLLEMGRGTSSDTTNAP